MNYNTIALITLLSNRHFLKKKFNLNTGIGAASFLYKKKNFYKVENTFIKFKKNIKKKPKLMKEKKIIFNRNLLNFNLNLNVSLFFEKLFNCFIKSGKKNLSTKFHTLTFWFLIVKAKNKKMKKTLYIYTFLSKIVYNILPLFIYTNFSFRGKSLMLPWVRKNKRLQNLKIIKIAAIWVKKSIYKRKEKTLFLKIFSELEDIRLNRGESIQLKKNYYSDFYLNKYYIRFLSKKKWV